jgi:hypothetical protein
MTGKALALGALLALSAGAGLAQTPAPALPPGPRIVRGTVAAVSDTALTVITDKGPREIALTPTWTVAVMKPVAVDAIQPGSFIGTSELPSADGKTGTSLEVHVFPPGLKMGEGHYGWDLQPGSMMTNGTVGTVTSGKAGSRELEVTYGTTPRHITVPAGVPVVQITGGARALVKVGVPVFLVAQTSATGALTAGSVSVGENGAKPPM